MNNTAMFLKFTFIVFSFLSFNMLSGQEQKVDENKILSLISKKVSMDKDGDFQDRYTIQIFYGEYQGAQRIKALYKSKGLPYEVEQKYEEPNHKIWVGSYRSKLEAEQALLKVREEFPNAFVLKP